MTGTTRDELRVMCQSVINNGASNVDWNVIVARALINRLDAEAAEPAEVKAIRERHAKDNLCEYESLSSDAVQAHKDRAALLAHISTLEKAPAPQEVTEALAVCEPDLASKIACEAANRIAEIPQFKMADADHLGELYGTLQGAVADVLALLPARTPGPTREQIAKELCQVMERNGCQCWDGLDKFNREIFYEQADAILALQSTTQEQKL